jgi:hypothetical protein
LKGVRYIEVQDENISWDVLLKMKISLIIYQNDSRVIRSI